MRWQFKVCLFLLLLGWTVFLGLAAYDTNMNISGIWYRFDYWSTSLVLSFVGAVFGLYGLGLDIKDSGWKFSDFIRIEIEDEDENDDFG
jgi:hypothetical protein